MRSLRTSLGATQVAFGAKLGVSRSLIAGVETAAPPSAEFVALLVRAFPGEEARILASAGEADQRRTPRSPRRAQTSLQRRIDVQIATGRWLEVRAELLHELPRASPGREHVWIAERLAEACFQLDLPDEGIRALGAAITACRDIEASDAQDREFALRSVLANRLLLSDAFHAAHQAVDAGLVDTPSAGILWHRKAHIHWYSHAYSDAYAAAMAAVKHGVPLRTILHTRGQILAEWGNPRAAIEDLTKVLADPEVTASYAAYARSTRAHALAQLGDFAQALAEWDIAEVVTPDNGWLHYFRALCCIEREDHPAAVVGLRRALACGSPGLNGPKRDRAQELLHDLASRLPPTRSGRKVLITAFDPFGEVAVNPSASLMARICHQMPSAVVSAVLPTSYERSWRLMRSLLEAHNPAAIVMLGFAERTRGLRLERWAANGSTTEMPDNDGQIGRSPIAPGGPDALETTAPLEQLVASCITGPAAVSTSAGGYVCNSLYFNTLDAVRAAPEPVPCLFIHIGDWEADEHSRTIVADVVGLIRRLAADSEGKPSPQR